MAQLIMYDIQELLLTLEGKKTFLVCGRSFDRLDIAASLNKHNMVRFSDFSANPVYEDVCKAVALFRESNCDAILAVGGGSAMDVAKCVKLFCKMDPSVNYLRQEYRDTGILLGAIPTTAGTGSESTRHAVIYFQGEKQSISHISLVPDYACLLPSVLESLPRYQKICTMLDALCQAVESWWSVNSTQESIAYSRRAIGLICENWQAYLEDHNREAAAKMLLAANESGRAINITATTAPHAMSYTLTSLYGIPHGHAVALCLPEVWEHMLRENAVCTDSRGKDHLARVLREIPLDPARFRHFLKLLDIKYPVSQNREKDLERLVKSVNPLRLKNNPVLLEEDALKAMYERIVG